VQSVKELMGSPGAASYALYSLSVLLLMDTVPYTLYPLLLREAWATYAVVKDLLYITGGPSSPILFNLMPQYQSDHSIFEAHCLPQRYSSMPDALTGATSRNRHMCTNSSWCPRLGLCRRIDEERR
jgi:hypothetical protein